MTLCTLQFSIPVLFYGETYLDTARNFEMKTYAAEILRRWSIIRVNASAMASS